MKKKILLTTLFGVSNYGTALQAYATQKVINNFGYDSKILNYTQKRLNTINVIKKSNKEIKDLKSRLYMIASVLYRFIPNIIVKRKFSKFINKYLSLTSTNISNYKDIDLKYDYLKYDCFITGSDQVWNYKYNEGIDYVYYLKFVPDNLRKISYASSIGMTDFLEEEKDEIKKLLKRYDIIGVREISAQEALNKMNIKCEVVLDPTMLLDFNDWKDIEKNINIKEKYLLVYILGRDKSIMKTAEKIAEEKNLKIIKIGLDFIYSSKIYRNYQYASPNEFIYLFRHADFVLTNSFHGLAFSINFNKQFLAITPKTYSTRLLSILSLFDLTDRIITNNDSTYLYNINYIEINKKLNDYRKKSIDFLDKSIKGDE